MDVVDQDLAEGILYPTLQDEKEERLEIDRNDIIPLRIEEYRSFPLDFRLRSIVIDSLARKYDQEYPSADGERFLLGPKAIKLFIKELGCPCPYMKKALDALEEVKNDKDELVAICLLETDDGAVNRQKFLAFTRDKMYLRFESNGVEDNYHCSCLRITPDAIEDNKEPRVDGKNVILEYPLPIDFRNFAQELLLLSRTTLLPISARHPMMDLPPSERERYLEFLVDAAAAEGSLGVHGIIYLEYLARSSHIKADKLETWLKEAYLGGLKENEINKRITELLATKHPLPIEYYHVFVMDILELIEGRDGEVKRPKLLNILQRKKNLWGEGFVEYFREAVKYRQQSEMCFYKMHQALQNIGQEKLEKLYRTNIISWQQYRHELSVKLLDIGVMVNEY